MAMVLARSLLLTRLATLSIASLCYTPSSFAFFLHHFRPALVSSSILHTMTRTHPKSSSNSSSSLTGPPRRGRGGTTTTSTASHNSNNNNNDAAAVSVPPADTGETRRHAPTITTPQPKRRRRKSSPASQVGTPNLCNTPPAAAVSAGGTTHKLPMSNDVGTSAKKSLTQQPPSTAIDKERFIDLGVAPTEFRPSASLTTGQSFHWQPLSRPTVVKQNIDKDTKATTSAWGVHNATDWRGTLRVTTPKTTKTQCDVVVHVRETPTTTLYKVLSTVPPALNVDAVLHQYFQLHVPLADRYDTWSQACPRLQQIAPCIPGVRILQQDPWETLISFIASSNNNIPRITQILATLRREYGTRIDMEQAQQEEVYSFPSLDELRAQTTEADLRRLGWGYRAKYVIQTMELLHQLGGEAYLMSLRQMNDPAAVQEALLQFPGVGRKVADCVALFSLNQTQAIPVDVHVWNIARRDYDDDQVLANVKSLTPSVYQQVGDIFRTRFGEYAGWAHSLLFVAELPSFRPVLPPSLIDEMETFQKEEQRRKQELKEAKNNKKKKAS